MTLPDDTLTGALPDPACAAGPDLLDRWQPLHDWVRRRIDSGIPPGPKCNLGRIGPRGMGRPDAAGAPVFGVQFAAQDRLSLSAHPAICEAAHAAIAARGVHSAGPVAMMGLSDLAERLEARIAGFLGLAGATVFPTGWAAGYGAVRTLVRPDDHVLIDALAPGCLQQGATAATRHVHRFAHLSTDAAARRLIRLRAEYPLGGILVVTRALFGQDSESPDLPALQALCRAHRATLLVDVAEDLGATGPGGRGVPGLQGLHGAIDVLVGSFSRTFAANGGFVAASHPALQDALRLTCGLLASSSALSPVQAAVVLAALDIVEGVEGEWRRARLLRHVTALREGLADHGYTVPGVPGTVVPVLLGDLAQARRMTAAMLEAGVFVHLLEPPAVPQGRCRWCLQPMAAHEDSDIARLLDAAETLRARFPATAAPRDQISRPNSPRRRISDRRNAATG